MYIQLGTIYIKFKRNIIQINRSIDNSINWRLGAEEAATKENKEQIFLFKICERLLVWIYFICTDSWLALTVWRKKAETFNGGHIISILLPVFFSILFCIFRAFRSSYLFLFFPIFFSLSLLLLKSQIIRSETYIFSTKLTPTFFSSISVQSI